MRMLSRKEHKERRKTNWVLDTNAIMGGKEAKREGKEEKERRCKLLGSCVADGG